MTTHHWLIHSWCLFENVCWLIIWNNPGGGPSSWCPRSSSESRPLASRHASSPPWSPWIRTFQRTYAAPPRVENTTVSSRPTLMCSVTTTQTCRYSAFLQKKRVIKLKIDEMKWTLFVCYLRHVFRRIKKDALQQHYRAHGGTLKAVPWWISFFELSFIEKCYKTNLFFIPSPHALLLYVENK